jgi:hypothetical protein
LEKHQPRFAEVLCNPDTVPPSCAINLEDAWERSLRLPALEIADGPQRSCGRNPKTLLFGGLEKLETAGRNRKAFWIP